MFHCLGVFCWGLGSLKRKNNPKSVGSVGSRVFSAVCSFVSVSFVSVQSVKLILMEHLMDGGLKYQS